MSIQSFYYLECPPGIYTAVCRESFDVPYIRCISAYKAIAQTRPFKGVFPRATLRYSGVPAMSLDRSASVTSWSSIETDERIRLTFDTEELFDLHCVIGKFEYLQIGLGLQGDLHSRWNFVPNTGLREIRQRPADRRTVSSTYLDA